MSRMVDLLIDLHNGAHGTSVERAIAALTPSAVIQPATPALTLTLLLDRYVRNLSAEGVPDVLGQQLTLGAVIFDLCVLAECPFPPAVAELIGATH